MSDVIDKVLAGADALHALLMLCMLAVAWVYRAEREERRDAQSKLLDITIKSIEANNATTAALQILTEAVKR